jgi:hypothetical protein
MAVTWQDIVVSMVFKLAALYMTLHLAGHRVRRLYMKINVQKYKYMNSCLNWCHYM